MNLARQVISSSIKATTLNLNSTSKSPTINLPILETNLIRSNNFKHFKQVLSQMISTGFIHDTYAASRLLKFSTDSRFVTLNYSSLIFSCIEEPNAFICNTMMSAHLRRNSSLFEAINLYRFMLLNHVAPDSYTYPILIQSCAHQFSVFAGKQFHSHVTKVGFDYHAHVLNTLINMYAISGDLSRARQLFDESPVVDSVSWNSILAAYVHAHYAEEAKVIYNMMPEKNIIASNSMIVLLGKLGRVTEAQALFGELPNKDMVSWSALISCHEQNGMCSEALVMFRHMTARGMPIDEVVMMSVVSACTHLLAIDEGRLIHGLTMKRGFCSYINLQNACIHMYASCGDMVAAKRLFDTSARLNLISYNLMLSGCFKCGFINDAKALFDSMPEKDVVSWSAMISGYTQHGRFSDILALFEEMQLANIKPDNITLVSVISACTHFVVLDQGKRTHDYIRKNCLKIDPILGTSLIDMYMKCGSVDDAMEVFHNLEEKIVSTWNSTILGLSMNGMMDKSLEMFSVMKSCGIDPNEITFIAVLGVCGHLGLVNEGRAYYNSMVKEYKIQPNVKHYGCMVDLLGRAGLLKEAEELIMSMPMAPDAATWGALLGACRNHGDFDMGERIGKKLIELEPYHDGFHVLLADIQASKGNWEDVLNIREKMATHQVAKLRGCSSVKADGDIQDIQQGTEKTDYARGGSPETIFLDEIENLKYHQIQQFLN